MHGHTFIIPCSQVSLTCIETKILLSISNCPKRIKLLLTEKIDSISNTIIGIMCKLVRLSNVGIDVVGNGL